MTRSSSSSPIDPSRRPERRTFGRIVIRRPVLLALVLVAAVGCRPAESRVVQRPGEPAALTVSPRDSALFAARDTARAHLAEFLDWIAAHPADSGRAWVKVAVTEREVTEHLWLGEVTYTAGVLRGIIDNAPLDLKGFEYGQAIRADTAAVSDWQYEEAGATHGNFTRPVLDSLAREDSLRRGAAASR